MVEVALSTMESPRRRFLRSIRIESDWKDDDALNGYVVTGQARHVLDKLVDGLGSSSSERAWTITGPYGTGKSSLGLFVSRLLSERADSHSPVWQILRSHDPDYAEDVAERVGSSKLLPILITARRATLVECLTQSIEALPREMHGEIAGDLEGVALRTEGILAVSGSADGCALEMIQSVSHAARVQGYSGVLLIVDEMGKILEHVARDPEHSDIFVLQELAEAASRSGDEPFFVVGILHQAFEQYAQYLDGAMRREWAKVQGRYGDIAFIEPPEQLIRLASEAVQAPTDQLRYQDAGHRSIVATAISDDLGLRPPAMAADDFEYILRKTGTLHPVLLVTLPYLFRRFAQNERSLFTYLVSQQPFGFRDQLDHRGREVVRVPDLFDYVIANLSGGLHRHTIHQRWLEVVDALETSLDLTPLEIDVIKTIGVLGVLADGSHLRASADMISFALTDRTDIDDIHMALQRLQERSMIVYRRFADSYRVWEGSDVDIDARIDEGRAKTGGHFSLASVLERYLHYRPMVARRHSHEFGTLRFFELRYLDEPPNESVQAGEANGVVVCCLPNSALEAQAFSQWATSKAMHESKSVLVALPKQISLLREVVGELVAMYWVQENTPTLRDDRIARRELQQRMAEIEAIISQQIDRLLDPRPSPIGTDCAWYWLGTEQPVRSLRNVSELVSHAMDALYPRSPRIYNELLNRRALSSAAAAARRTLIERMLSQADVQGLGIEGYPPERAIYESTLSSPGLHRETDGAWGFHPPHEVDTNNLLPAWTYLEEAVFAAVGHPIGVAQLFSKLSAPPYGVTAGYLPVLLCAFLQVRHREVSLYREGVFIPEPGIADFEILLRRPELFALGGASIAGDRQVIIDRLARSLDAEPATLPVVRELLRRFRTLPQHALRTQRLQSTTLHVRTSLQQGTSPERLLFHDLPLALEMDPFLGDGPTSEARITQFFEGINQALSQLNEITTIRVLEARDSLLEACNVGPGDEGWSRLVSQARHLEPRVSSTTLLPFLRRLSADADDRSKPESVLALVSNRPPRSWTDTDLDRFDTLAEQIGERFREASTMHMLLSPAEEVESAELACRITTTLGDDVPQHILRAALIKLLNRL